MADDQKPPHAPPPLAQKGDARPMAPGAPSPGAAAKAMDDKRPSGLHTRPDLFGSSAVLRRPNHLMAEDSAEIATPAENEAQAVDPVSDPPGTPQPPETTGQSAPPVGVFLPVANLQDHPLRIPESISFEDWPDGPEAEPEDGARSPEGASLVAQEAETEIPDGATEEPDTAAPEAPETPEVSGFPDQDELQLDHPLPDPPELDDLAFPEQPTVAARPPDWTAPPLAALPERSESLLARVALLASEVNLSRLAGSRWLLPAGAVACAVLMVAGLSAGLIPIPGEDRDGTQLAQESGAPNETSGLGGQDLPVTPAGSTLAYEGPTGEGPDSGPQDSQVAAMPNPLSPEAAEQVREPIVDFMRIDPDGKAVVAGRAAPGTELTVLDNGTPLGSVTADIYGLWTFVSQQPLAGGRHEIGLEVRRQGTEVSGDSVLVTDSGTAAEPLAEEAEVAETTAAVPEQPVETVAQDASREFAEDSPEDLAQAFEGVEQLAAAAPEEPVQSDASANPPAPAEPTVPAEAAESAEPEPEVAASAVPDTLPAPAPKPEPPSQPTQVQTAALPSETAAPAGGTYVVQFASFRNRETAAREQSLVEESFADLLTGQEIFIQQADVADQGTFYRVRLGPFASLSDARASCARFQARDRDCLAMAR